MIRYFFLCCYLSLVSGFVCAQSLEKRAAKSIKKAKWDKAASFLNKAIARDSSNVIAEYLWSCYYFDKRNPRYNIVFAYNAITQSIDNFRNLTPRQREKLNKFPLDSGSVVKLREQIDSVSFTEARLQNTEEGYIDFLQRHPFSSDRRTAEQLRNAVAFLNAVNQNTFKAFKSFLDKYPDATEKDDARARYERLLFEEKTRDRRLASFESFLKEYPETPFRKEIEKDIFELYTLSGEVERFMSYLRTYPESPFQKRATNILFHILNDGEDPALSGIPLTDSLERIVAADQGYLVPFLKKGKFGFMSASGFELIPPSFGDLPDNYLCGNITDDLIIFSDRIINRLGSTIFKGEVGEVDDIGSGFLKVTTNRCIKVIHKSGFVIDTCVLDAKMIDKRFIAVQTESGWNIHSLSGRNVLSKTYKDIGVFGQAITLNNGENYTLITLKQVGDQAEDLEQEETLVVDQVKLLKNGMLWVSTKKHEGIVDQNITELVPIADHTIQEYFAGFIIRSPEGISLYDERGRKSSFFENVVVNEPIVIVTKGNKHYVYDVTDQSLRSEGYDSVAFDGTFMKGWVRDSLYIHFHSGRLSFQQQVKTSFVSGKDSASFILVESEGKKAVYNSEGVTLFAVPTLSFESIQHAGGEFFIVSKKDKKGVVNGLGKMVIPIEFDGIGTLANQTISVLKAGRFGLLNVASRKLIKPQYDKNLMVYKNNLLVATKENKQGFIDWENRLQTKFEFDEVKYWNDSVVLVRKEKLWEMFSLTNGKAILTDIREIIPVRETANEKLFILNQNNLFGVVSSTRGKIIPFSFSDLVNVGSAEEPLYFTEKHVAEASVFVVIYYDRNGKMLRREVYEEPEDYDKIYCQGN